VDAEPNETVNEPLENKEDRLHSHQLKVTFTAFEQWITKPWYPDQGLHLGKPRSVEVEVGRPASLKMPYVQLRHCSRKAPEGNTAAAE